MSFDLNKMYDTIKTQISTLPVVQAHIQAISTNSSIEHFTLPPFPPLEQIPNFKDILKSHPDDPVAQTLVTYNVDQREVYDVISDFDQLPNNLSNDKKVLRKKYLNIILSVMDDKHDTVKSILTKIGTNPSDGPGGPGGPDPKMKEMFLLYGLGNYDPGYNTIKRIIKLLIMEIDLNGSTSCPVCSTCPGNTDNTDNIYFGVIVGLIIILVIMSIVLTMSDRK